MHLLFVGIVTSGTVFPQAAARLSVSAGDGYLTQVGGTNGTRLDWTYGSVSTMKSVSVTSICRVLHSEIVEQEPFPFPAGL